MSETMSACALEGCDQQVVRRPGGGRPRLYCSDAHRAEARRRRLAAGDLPGDGDDVLADARRLLTEALSRLDQAAGRSDAREGARVAALRAEATAQVLEAQQLAADATRRAESVWSTLERERAGWETARRALVQDAARGAASLQELTGALDGARAELEQELVRHHHDVDDLTRRLHAQGAAHAAAVAEAETLGRTLADTAAALERAEERATRAETALRQGDEMRRELDVRCTRAEEQAKQAASRVRQLEVDIKQLRRDLVTERKQRATVLAELGRHLADQQQRPRRTGARRTGVTS